MVIGESMDDGRHIHVTGRRLRLQWQTETFLLHRSFLPPMGARLLFPFFPLLLSLLSSPRPTATTMINWCSVSLLTCLLRASSFPSSSSRIGRLSSTQLPSCAARGDDDDGDDYRLLRTFLRIRAFQRLARPSADL